MPDTPVITSVMNQSISEVLVVWSMTVPETNGHGAITHFTIYVDSNAVENVANGTALSYIIRNLAPYQLVTAQVSASTSAGEGARSAAMSGRSSEARKWHRIGTINPGIIREVVLPTQNIVYSCAVAVFHFTQRWQNQKGYVV